MVAAIQIGVGQVRNRVSRFSLSRPQSTNLDDQVFKTAARKIGIQVAALSAVMVLAGAVLLLAYFWIESKEHHGSGSDLALNDLDLEDLLQIGLVVGVGVVVMAGLGALLFARRAVQPLEESMRRQRNFVGDASHELRTPLAVLSVRAQQLEMMVGQDSELQPVVAELRAGTLLMTEIVNDLLVSVTDPGVVARPARLAAVLTDVHDDFRLLAERRQIILDFPETESTFAEVFVPVPHVPLRRALGALVDNAIGHSPQGSTVRVYMTTESNIVEIRVEDQGSGIRGIEPERVFERFAHGATVVDGISGQDVRSSHGIGLALVRDVLSRHSGTVEVERTDADGTTFCVVLPRLTSEQVDHYRSQYET